MNTVIILQGEQYSYKEALVLLDYKVEDVPISQNTLRTGNRDKVCGIYMCACLNLNTFKIYE